MRAKTAKPQGSRIRLALQVRVDEDEVVPDYGDAEDEGVDAVEDAAVTGEQAAGIFDACGAFAGGLEEVAHLSGDVAEDGHGEEVGDWDRKPEMEGVGNEEGAEHAGEGAFPSFFGGDVRGEGMLAEGAAGEVGDGIGGPGDGEGEEEEAGTVGTRCNQEKGLKPLEADRV